MGVNSFPKTVSRQRRGCDLKPGPSASESSTLTTRLLSHPRWTRVLLSHVLMCLIQKAWLRVRNLTARCLVAAVRVPADMQSAAPSQADGESVNNGETAVSRCPTVGAVKQLGGELKTTLDELSAAYAGKQTDEVNLFCCLVDAVFPVQISLPEFCDMPSR